MARRGWKGRPWHEAVLYELHIGAFTGAGTFLAAVEKLDHLASLGITALEIMPVSDFPGRRNWGYDGVLPYAPESTYGRPEDFKALIDAAHARRPHGLARRRLQPFWPGRCLSARHSTGSLYGTPQDPWGAGINMDGADARTVRDFFIHNALYWIEEFNLDGCASMRCTQSRTTAQGTSCKSWPSACVQPRPAGMIHLILENEANEAERLIRQSNGAPRWYTAQWNDDVHHVLHVAAHRRITATMPNIKATRRSWLEALAEGFAFRGELMPFVDTRAATERQLASRSIRRIHSEPRSGRQSGVRRSADYDRVGKRAAGHCGHLSVPSPNPHAVHGGRMGATALPVLHFGPDLADAVRNGRREEFARFPEFQNPAMRERIPTRSPTTPLPRPSLRGRTCPATACRVARVVSPDPCCPTSRSRTAPLAYSVRRPLRSGRRWGRGGTLGRCKFERAVLLAANLHPAPHAGFPASSSSCFGGKAIAGTTKIWPIRGALVHRDRDRHSPYGPSIARSAWFVAVILTQRCNKPGVPPSPLWGEDWGGGREFTAQRRATTSYPPPQPSPNRSRACPTCATHNAQPGQAPVAWGREQTEFAARPKYTSPARAVASQWLTDPQSQPSLQVRCNSAGNVSPAVP